MSNEIQIRLDMLEGDASIYPPKPNAISPSPEYKEITFRITNSDEYQFQSNDIIHFKNLLHKMIEKISYE